ELVSLDNLGRALELLNECPEDLREWEWQYLMRLCRVEPVVLRDKTEVTSVSFSPDGEYLASAGGGGARKVWENETREVFKTVKDAHAEAVVSVAFHPGGRYVASAGLDRSVKVWDLTSGQEVFAEPMDVHHKFGSARTVAFSHDGGHVAAASDGAVKV